MVVQVVVRLQLPAFLTEWVAWLISSAEAGVEEVTVPTRAEAVVVL